MTRQARKMTRRRRRRWRKKKMMMMTGMGTIKVRRWYASHKACNPTPH
jgi:hypothetical protein